MELEVPYARPLDVGAVLEFLRPRAVARVEHVGADAYTRTLGLPGGAAVVTVRDAGGALVVDARLADPGDAAAAAEVVRRIFDAGAPAAAIDATLAAVPELAPRVAAHPGLRVPGAADAAELLVRAVVGQQITVAAATGMLARMAEEGDPVEGDDRVDRVFPALGRIAASAHRHYRGPATRIATLRGLEDAVDRDPTLLAPPADPDEYRRALTAVRGIGAWTAAYVAMRVATARDILLPGDAGVRAGARALGIADRLDEVADAVAPWRSSLTVHLWAAAVDARPVR